MCRVAIVAALEREVHPLVKNWRVNDWPVNEKEIGGRRFRFFESENCVLVCGGIGAEAARKAAEAVIANYAPSLIYSAGFAGALESTLKVGDVVQPRMVINAGDGSRVNLDRGEGMLVSFGSIASPEQKATLAQSFGAQAVDMEAAAVARAAEARGVPFAVVKVISDECDFIFPSLERFIDSNGQFRQSGFAWFTAWRPWLWPRVARLARNSNRASLALCDWLSKMIAATAKSSGVPTAEVLHRS